VRVSCQERCKIIWDFTAAANRKVETARPGCRGTYVPQGYAGFVESPNALVIRRLQGDVKKTLDNPPEHISRIRVVLASPERLFAGKGPQDQDRG